MLQPWLTLRILRKQREAEDIFSFDLASRDGEALPSFDAGSHIDVKVAEGIVRQYSLCNSPDDRRLYRVRRQGKSIRRRHQEPSHLA
ncbi:hypothetical protein [Roseomonas sp. TAS13]|uniref:hypothetical protein n=1 Tax=Roseomonas sp. TAS13 TaxID=1926319 RepID=UPI000A6386D5|nr:hypothetical protein [Roseomonas sp. TAS13]USQ73765.1 hypothetical protein NF552_20760 [Roseomonas mucosa]